MALRLEARDILWIPGSSSVENTQNLVLGGGLTLAFGGRSHDADFDGITD